MWLTPSHVAHRIQDLAVFVLLRDGEVQSISLALLLVFSYGKAQTLNSLFPEPFVWESTQKGHTGKSLQRLFSFFRKTLFHEPLCLMGLASSEQT